MPIYNFKRESKVYLVVNNLKYLLEVYPDLTYSQTFSETNVPVKTLHSQRDMFENAVITKANPANFSFTIPIIRQGDMDILLKMLRDYNDFSTEATLNTADLYVEANSEVYKLEKAVFESGTFQLSTTAVITLSLSGTASKLQKYTGVIPGILQARTTNKTYTRITSMSVAISGATQQSITSVSIELKNDVRWLDFATLQKSTGISDASGTQFPEAFVVSGRTLSGTIQQYVTDETRGNVNSWKLNTPIALSVGMLDAPALTFNIPSAVYTNRLDPQEVFIQSYDFRMTANPSLLTVVNKITI